MLPDKMERFWNLQRSQFVNHNGAEMVDELNVNKLIAEAQTKMEVGKLRTLSLCHQTKWGPM